MELTLESAFSTGGMVGHVAYFLLVISMLMRNMIWLRIFVIISALVAIAYAVVWLKDPVSAFWETLLVTVNVVQIAITWMNNRRARFTDEERALVDARLSTLDPHQARRVLNLGTWVLGQPGDELTREGTPVSHLSYISAGRVQIAAGGTDVATCGPGNFVGEMSLVGDTDASATAILSEPTRYWALPAEAYRRLCETDPALSSAFMSAISMDLKAKLLAANSSRNMRG